MKVLLVEMPIRYRPRSPVLAPLRGQPEHLIKFRTRRGYTAQNIAVSRAPGEQGCVQCGKSGHQSNFCSAPVRRAWGWPGWEDGLPLGRLAFGSRSLAKRLASRSTDSPSTTKQIFIASRACSSVRTTTNLLKSTPSKPKRPRTSKGMPAKPQ